MKKWTEIFNAVRGRVFEREGNTNLDEVLLRPIVDPEYERICHVTNAAFKWCEHGASDPGSYLNMEAASSWLSSMPYGGNSAVIGILARPEVKNELGDSYRETTPAEDQEQLDNADAGRYHLIRWPKLYISGGLEGKYLRLLLAFTGEPRVDGLYAAGGNEDTDGPRFNDAIQRIAEDALIARCVYVAASAGRMGQALDAYRDAQEKTVSLMLKTARLIGDAHYREVLIQLKTSGAAISGLIPPAGEKLDE